MATEYKVEGSNVEDIGSAMDKAARHAAAMTDVEWDGAGKNVGLEIWRVENKRMASGEAQFGIKAVAREAYGSFYRGDSYIVLSTFKDKASEALCHDIHFWIGAQSSADEYGVAAYKTVELDDLLGGSPVQHREIEGYESSKFLSYFGDKGPAPGGVRYMEGGIESGFRHVKTEEYKPRLLQVKKELGVVKATEVPLGLESLNVGDCFILDSGGKIFVFRGDESDGFEKFKAVALAEKMEGERNGKSKVVDSEDDEEFWSVLGAAPGAAIAAAVPKTTRTQSGTGTCLELYSMNNDSLEFEKIADGPFAPDQLKEDDVMLINTGTHLFVAVGPVAPLQEKCSAMFKAQDFLKKKGMPPQTGITRVITGGALPSPKWNACFA